ncbi:SigE family RNA polymerase sigma factor [Kribbella monticola]|uniref:SigE family RNA polymerase sigma factor n=1 Tax=Kribbella monticola TaxID=2185285 RepID=UPI000DD3432E|nr:SigE family RNA polymerase sigma factor [Kribbella monticola]
MGDRDREYVEFVEAASSSLRRTAYLVCGDWHRADDVVQDALYKLYLAWSKVDRSGNPLAYARRVVVNTALDSGRRPWRREVPTDTAPDLTSYGGDPAGTQADQDELRTALAVLSPRQRACVVLRYYEDLSVDQTAEILGCTTGTVKSQSSRALQTLRQAMTRARQIGHAS